MRGAGSAVRKEPPEGQAGSREGRHWACGSARESKRPYRLEEWVRVCQAPGVVVLERASRPEGPAGTEAQSLKGQCQRVSLSTTQGPVCCVEASSAGFEWWGTSRGLQAQE